MVDEAILRPYTVNPFNYDAVLGQPQSERLLPADSPSSLSLSL